MTKTVKEHIANCKQVSQIVEDANALLHKVQSELYVSRAVLEALIEYQHQKMIMRAPSEMRHQNSDAVPVAKVIRDEIARINEILGDRA